MQVRWTCRALRNLESIADYIAKDRPMAAPQVVSRVEKAIADLRDFPEMGRIGRVPGTRELVVSNTPLIVAYRIRKEDLELLAVVHGARDWPQEF